MTDELISQGRKPMTCLVCGGRPWALTLAEQTCFGVKLRDTGSGREPLCLPCHYWFARCMGYIS